MQNTDPSNVSEYLAILKEDVKKKKGLKQMVFKRKMSFLEHSNRKWYE